MATFKHISSKNADYGAAEQYLTFEHDEFTMKPSVPQTAATFIMVLAMLPFFMFAMYEKHGQPLETILGNIIRVFFLTPKERPYRTENYYAVLGKQAVLAGAACTG